MGGGVRDRGGRGGPRVTPELGCEGRRPGRPVRAPGFCVQVSDRALIGPRRWGAAGRGSAGPGGDQRVREGIRGAAGRPLFPPGSPRLVRGGIAALGAGSIEEALGPGRPVSPHPLPAPLTPAPLTPAPLPQVSASGPRMASAKLLCVVAALGCLLAPRVRANKVRAGPGHGDGLWTGRRPPPAGALPGGVGGSAPQEPGLRPRGEGTRGFQPGVLCVCVGGGHPELSTLSFGSGVP